MGRRLGQHFLHDPGILDRIVSALDPGPDDVVLEIGPGRGTLTRRLLRRVAGVVAIELDGPLARALQEERLAGLTVVQGDALEADWADLMRSATDGRLAGGFKVVGNVPYYISTPLLDRALTCPDVGLVVFLLQKEVADRIVAAPGSKAYGALSVGIQAAADVDRIMRVKAGAFRPPPSVDSAVVRMAPRDEALVPPARRAEFGRFVRGLFGQRRKRLGRSLRAVLGVDADTAARLLAAVGVSPDQRVETLSPATVAALFQAAD